ncbi:uncharacterized protein DEA37_0014320 [Paragonimus westermani]|uniref:Uncharacterized protein n=1 Tax=Paragonimus westermani TaxID=34504 RepID=A0A5J4NF52_9TREM|nr:uncharacterized protein DEA37_0014320 [Paragonimus westermani]
MSYHRNFARCTSCPSTSEVRFSWKSAVNGEVPKSAIIAGFAEDGSPLHIARTLFQNEVLVGKFPDKRVYLSRIGGIIVEGALAILSTSFGAAANKLSNQLGIFHMI